MRNEPTKLGIRSYIFPWPVSSPNLAPFEAPLKKIKPNITHHNPYPTMVPGLHYPILEKWESLTSEVIANYTEAVPERIHDFLAARGGHIKW